MRYTTSDAAGEAEGEEEIVDAGGELQSVPDGSRTELCGYHFTVPSLVNPLLSSVALLTLAVSLALRFSLRSQLGPAIILSHPRTYQRQGNLICSPVRKTLTEFSVWFLFIPVHTPVYLYIILHPYVYNGIDYIIDMKQSTRRSIFCNVI